ncbi:MAG: hypothetical protein AABZ58_14100 [Chloroflexota bacterium]
MPETVLSRFLRYVKIYTTSDPDSHGPHEYACVQEMELSVKMLTELVQLWAKKGASYKKRKKQKS